MKSILEKILLILIAPVGIAFIIALGVILVPVIIVTEIIDAPFKKKRMAALNELIARDWAPRKKYIYIHYYDDFSLAGFVEDELLVRYKDHIIWDKWSSAQSEATHSEENHKEFSCIDTDIIGNYDGDSMLAIVMIRPDRLISASEEVLDFYESDEKGHLMRHGVSMSQETAKEVIILEIEKCLAAWKDKDDK